MKFLLEQGGIEPCLLHQLFRRCRESYCAHNNFLSYAARHVHKFELTLQQFDVIITLGAMPGLSPKKLGEKILITKGALTGVISRLEDKGLMERVAPKKDGRSQIIRLTEAGHALYESAFPEHLNHIHQIFKDYAPEDFKNLETALLQLRKAVVVARCQNSGELADETSGWCTKIKGVANITKTGNRDRGLQGCRNIYPSTTIEGDELFADLDF